MLGACWDSPSEQLAGRSSSLWMSFSEPESYSAIRRVWSWATLASSSVGDTTRFGERWWVGPLVVGPRGKSREKAGRAEGRTVTGEDGEDGLGGEE